MKVNRFVITAMNGSEEKEISVDLYARKFNVFFLSGEASFQYSSVLIALLNKRKIRY